MLAVRLPARLREQLRAQDHLLDRLPHRAEQHAGQPQHHAPLRRRRPLQRAGAAHAVHQQHDRRQLRHHDGDAHPVAQPVRGCTANSTAGLLTATSGATSNLSATVTATTGAGSPRSQSVTITPPPLDIQSVTLNPSTVTGGGATTATVALNRDALAGDPTAAVSIRISEGLLSGTQLATFPGCAGSPVCVGTATVPVGSRTVSVTVATQDVAAEDMVTIAAMADWARTSASRNLTIAP
jgi:hypothetical protein